MNASRYLVCLLAVITVVAAVPLASQVKHGTPVSTTTGPPPPPPPSGCGKCDCTGCTEPPKPPKLSQPQHVDLGSPAGRKTTNVGEALIQTKGGTTSVMLQASVPPRKTYSVYLVDPKTYKIKSEKKVAAGSGSINTTLTTDDKKALMLVVSPRSKLKTIKSTDVTIATAKPQ